jgi:hypothetical protein
MATKYLGIGKRKKNRLSRPAGSSNSSEKMMNHVTNHDIYELFRLSKSPLTHIPKHSSSIFSSKDVPSSTPRLSNRIKTLTRRRTVSSSNYSKNSKILSKFSKKPENFRYLDVSVDESFRNLNGVSTPPDDYPSSSVSPYSQVIEQQLNTYLNSPLTEATKTMLKKEKRLKLGGSFIPIAKDSVKKSEKKPLLERNLKRVPPVSHKAFYSLVKIFPSCFRRSRSQKK